MISFALSDCRPTVLLALPTTIAPDFETTCMSSRVVASAANALFDHVVSSGADALLDHIKRSCHHTATLCWIMSLPPQQTSPGLQVLTPHLATHHSTPHTTGVYCLVGHLWPTMLSLRLSRCIIVRSAAVPIPIDRCRCRFHLPHHNCIVAACQVIKS